MGYIDKELGIKSVSGIKKYLTKYFNDKGYQIELDCVKVASSVRCFWAINNKLHQYDMKGSVIYVIQEEDLNQLIYVIQKSLPPNNNS
jgi:hypothetical protein